jgi:hypothetical protein
MYGEPIDGPAKSAEMLEGGGYSQVISEIVSDEDRAGSALRALVDVIP